MRNKNEFMIKSKLLGNRYGSARRLATAAKKPRQTPKPVFTAIRHGAFTFVSPSSIERRSNKKKKKSSRRKKFCSSYSRQRTATAPGRESEKCGSRCERPILHRPMCIRENSGSEAFKQHEEERWSDDSRMTNADDDFLAHYVVCVLSLALFLRSVSISLSAPLLHVFFLCIKWLFQVQCQICGANYCRSFPAQCLPPAQDGAH